MTPEAKSLVNKSLVKFGLNVARTDSAISGVFLAAYPAVNMGLSSFQQSYFPFSELYVSKFQFVGYCDKYFNRLLV